MDAYVDTNIFVYVALKHPTYGGSCKEILADIWKRRINAYCSFLVPIEILGSIAEIDRDIAAGALTAFFSLPINLIAMDERLIHEAADIMRQADVTYAAVHAAAMKRHGLDTVITEDVEHWKKIRNIKIIRPLEYMKSK